MQEKFIFDVEEAKHSLHMQKKFNPTVRKAIAEYLAVLDA